ncbi:MAG: sporulation protein Cse60 [Bacillales bacterium]|nr:sporulation protein Cse60 [Bacillales bacterium]
MTRVEIFSSNKEDDITMQVNYYLKQLDDNLIKDIKYSSFAFFDGKEVNYLYSVLIVYIVIK